MQSDKPLKLFRIWDLFLILLMLVLVGLTIWFALSPKQGEYAEIYVDGKQIRTVSLAEDQIIDLDCLQVVVQGGKVSVVDADCPDKICEKRGEIFRKGESIVCLPNRVVVKIAGKGEVEAIS